MTSRSRAPWPVVPLLGGSVVVLAGGFTLCSRVTSHFSSPTAAPANAQAASVAARPSSGGVIDVSIAIHCDRPAHAISPLIYGIGVQPNHDAPDSQEWLLGATARRWGGNHTSRYNWERGNAWNTGKDWYFENVDYDHAKTPAYQRFLDDDVAHKMATALTVPILGWVAKDTTSYAFPVSLYGPQEHVSPDNPDMGNGVGADGEPLPPGNPERTSVAMTPDGIARWVKTIRDRDATSGHRSVQMYILDNEPTLWSTTHRDVHPRPVSYDELLQRTVDYATAIRQADPDAVIAGPALWGWSAYFHSGVDQAAHPAHPDQDAHGGMPLLPWWLHEVATRERQTGTRLIDVVDVHFYPQGDGIGIGVDGKTDPDTAARRIRSTRSLWDPTYKDESWIDDKMQVIPRIRKWIDENHPGSGISIGEWNFGAERDMSGGLAVAEALGHFGVEGIRSAFYWDYPERDSPAFWAFRAFRNFDGKGGRFLDESIAADSSDPRVSVFASRDPSTHRLVLILLALDPSQAVTARVDSSSCGGAVDDRRFAYSGGPSGFASVPAAGSGSPISMPPYSIAVVDRRFEKGP